MSAACGTSGSSSGRYDLAVIGAGSAGFSAAITAAEQGARVALIGHGTIGGTCVNVGCVPSKTLIRAAGTLHHAKTARRFAGIRAEGKIEDWRALLAQKDELVESLRKTKYTAVLSAYSGVDYMHAPARLTVNGVTVNGSDLGANKIIIATGSQPVIPAIPRIEGVRYLTSTTAFELEELPQSLLVIGGGYIGCELAQMLARFGVTVTLVCRSRLLPEAEPEISAALTTVFRDEGISTLGNLSYQSIKPTAQGVALRVETKDGDQTLEADQVLVAAGRRPNTDGLNLKTAGIAQRADGGIVVDTHMRTSREGTYAAGDVIGEDQFVYMAAYGAKIAAENALNGDSRRYDSSTMPRVVFTDPQVASVGLTEAVAKAGGTSTKTSVLYMDQVPRALTARDTRGVIKLVAKTNNGRLLGAHILAPEGADSVQTAALAIRQGLTYTELGEMIFPYLTTVEGLKLAAQTFDMDVTKLSCCAG